MKKKILGDADVYSVKSSLHEVILMSHQSDYSYSLLENFPYYPGWTIKDKMANKPIAAIRLH